MGDVYKELKHLSERYIKLRKLFGELHSGAMPLLTGGDIVGLQIQALTNDGTTFDASLAGTVVRFAFSMTDTEKGAHALVSCFRLDPLIPGRLSPIGHFNFNGQGDTELKGSSGDSLLVGTDADACLLVAKMLHKAITTPPELS